MQERDGTCSHDDVGTQNYREIFLTLLALFQFFLLRLTQPESAKFGLSLTVIVFHMSQTTDNSFPSTLKPALGPAATGILPCATEATAGKRLNAEQNANQS